MDASAETLIDLGAITANAAALAGHARGTTVMAVVKSDGYGHGMVPGARAALAGGASWLGVISVDEALALRAAGLTAPVLCLMGVPHAAHADAIGHDVDLSAGTVGMVGEIAAAARQAGRPARVHLKVDTGMSRGGATAADWPAVIEAARRAEAASDIQIIGVWSHLACADMPGHPSIGTQVTAFREAVVLAERAGARPQVRHLANTPATLTLPQTWFDLVRTGGRHRRVLRTPVHHRRAQHARACPAGIRRGGATQCVRPGRGAGARAPPGHLRDGVHEPVRRRLR
jgi:alanine racemase